MKGAPLLRGASGPALRQHQTLRWVTQRIQEQENCCKADVHATSLIKAAKGWPKRSTVRHPTTSSPGDWKLLL